MGSFPIPESYFIGLGCEIFLHGLYTGLFLTSTYLLLFKKKKSRVIAVMTLVNILMYIVATAHLIINFKQDLSAFLSIYHNNANASSVFHNTSSAIQWSQLILGIVNVPFGDGIVIWRAWILWNRRRWIIASSVVLLLVTVGSGSGLVYTVAMTPAGATFTDSSVESWAIAFIISTFSTNLWTTALVAYRTWSHFKLVRHLTGISILGSFRKQSAILPILIESGTLYCCTWLIVIVIFISSSNAIYVMIDTISQLTAMYPTLIITLVCIKSTLDVAIETFHQTQTNTQTQSQSWTRRPPAPTQGSLEDFTTTASSDRGLGSTLGASEDPSIESVAERKALYPSPTESDDALRDCTHGIV
ncbi:uncharacterized protein EV420DRAFT_727226 [Desarmillaria tabescens]|uniref:Uncharacterized protein n=1 Tax=Armillaria tabescens TaxID=1929756 RepID=A0AA39MZ33_ARMTA|nr:uncharacterized protein EV420DRAFT_727226 [Desarmillaria tabescens]KAK0451205.1 hypothetical protein EV420DRAFT_727226 [Desarmillaria tabescens]